MLYLLYSKRMEREGEGIRKEKKGKEERAREKREEGGREG